MSIMSNFNDTADNKSFHKLYPPAAAAVEGRTSYEPIPFRNYVGVFVVMLFVAYYSMTDSWLVGGPDTKVGGCLL